MFTFIIIILVVAFTVGFLKNLTPAERSIVIRRTINATTYGATAVVKTTKSTVKATYQAGQVAGIEMAISGQDSLKAMAEHNAKVASEGGAVKQAVVDVNKLSDNLGLSNVNTDLAARIAERKAVLEALRAEVQSTAQV